MAVASAGAAVDWSLFMSSSTKQAGSASGCCHLSSGCLATCQVVYIRASFFSHSAHEDKNDQDSPLLIYYEYTLALLVGLADAATRGGGPTML